MFCLWTLSYMNLPISLIFSLRMFSCFINSSLFSSQYSLVQAGIILNKTNQVICSHFLFFLYKPWYINSKKKKLSKKKIDLTYLPYFKWKKKKNKKKKENRPTYPVSNFHQIVNTHIFFFGLTCIVNYNVK